MPKLSEYFKAHREQHLQDLQEFLKIPSISALPEHAEDVRRAAEWAAAKLREAGMPRVDILETDGHPSVYGEWIVDAALPTVLIYGHVDVQPVDPEHLWESPPFEPTVRDGRLYARGVCDDKGNLWIPLKAMEALAKVNGRPPLNIKFLLEGEEEVGSPNLAPLLRREVERLKADVVLCADGGFYLPQRPSITLGSRGLCALQLHVRGPKGDLHSGEYGGSIQNPIHALAQMLAGMRAPDGGIIVDGFYDGVRELTPAEREAMAALPFDEAAYLEELGVKEPFGEPGFTNFERRWARPTLEVNGIWGGFQGEGTKTVLPAEAHAKITCRLVPDQDPEQVLDAIEAHVRRHTPPGVEVTVHRFPGSAKAYLMEADHPVIHKAAEALREVYGEEPALTRTGGTLPVAEMVESILQTDFVFFTFGDPDSNIHAPNEFLRLESFDKGVRAYARLLQGLADGGLAGN